MNRNWWKIAEKELSSGKLSLWGKEEIRDYISQVNRGIRFFWQSDVERELEYIKQLIPGKLWFSFWLSLVILYTTREVTKIKAGCFCGINPWLYYFSLLNQLFYFSSKDLIKLHKILKEIKVSYTTEEKSLLNFLFELIDDFINSSPGLMQDFYTCGKKEDAFAYYIYTYKEKEIKQFIENWKEVKFTNFQTGDKLRASLSKPRIVAYKWILHDKIIQNRILSLPSDDGLQSYQWYIESFSCSTIPYLCNKPKTFFNLFSFLLQEKEEIVWVDLGAGKALAQRQFLLDKTYSPFQARVKLFSLELLDTNPDKHPGIEFIETDVTHFTLPCKPDLITAIQIFPYLDDPLGFFTHWYNQLNPGGIFLLGAVNSFSKVFPVIFKSKIEEKEIFDWFTSLGEWSERPSRDGFIYSLLIHKKDVENLKLDLLLSGPRTYQYPYICKNIT